MENEWRYFIPNLMPYDVNHCYTIRRGAKILHKGRLYRYCYLNYPRRFLIPQAKVFKETLKKAFESQDSVRGKPDFEYYSTTITIHVPPNKLRTKSGKMTGIDASNYIKLIEDAYFEYLGKNDSYNCKVTAEKRESSDGNWNIELRIGEGKLLVGGGCVENNEDGGRMVR